MVLSKLWISSCLVSNSKIDANCFAHAHPPTTDRTIKYIFRQFAIFSYIVIVSVQINVSKCSEVEMFGCTKNVIIFLCLMCGSHSIELYDRLQYLVGYVTNNTESQQPNLMLGIYICEGIHFWWHHSINKLCSSFYSTTK